MFKFNRLLDATRGTWYYIDSARLATDEYDWSPNGGNAFTVGLKPLVDDELLPIFGLTLSVSNNGSYAMITKNLDKQASTCEEYSEELMEDVIHEDMQECIVDGSTLIVTQDVSGCALDDLLEEPPESVGEAVGIIKAFRAVMKAERRKPAEIAEMAERVSTATGIKLPDNFVKTIMEED